MENSMVRNALEAFNRNDYRTALDIYTRLSGLLGRKNFNANIQLTEERLRKQLGRNFTYSLPKEIKVACIMDEFTFQSYAPECDLLQLTPENAINELEAFKPHLLFIESAWRGKDELWNRKIGTLSQELKSILAWCKAQYIPTVFWNKEDPIHFETFLTTAQQFDFVFTTDIDCIARYKAALDHERVYLLPFACQPKTHNPIELHERKDAFCFAGAYYVRYPERTRDLENYVTELTKFKSLEIYDRNHGKDEVIYKDYLFPDKFKPYIIGTLPFNEIDKAYKGYRYAINLNSIKQSQTMFARRVYELLGSNTITVSNFSRGVRILFGDLVFSSDSGTEIVNRLTRLTAEDAQKLRLAGLRKVMLEHTYQHRLAYVLSKALGRQMENVLPPMLVVAIASTNDAFQTLVQHFKRQTHSNKHLLIVAAGHLRDPISGYQEENMTVIKTVQQAGKEMLERSQTGHWLAPIVAEDYYGPNYLLDLAIATGYSGTDLVGKKAHYGYEDATLQLIDPERAYRPVHVLAKRCSAIRMSALSKERLENPDWLHQLVTADWALSGMSIDPFNYARNGQSIEHDVLARRVDDLALNTGLRCEHLIQLAENIPPAEISDIDVPRWTGQQLLKLVNVSGDAIHFTLVANGLQIQSNLPDGKHEYLYASEDLPLASLPATKVLQTHLDSTPGLDVQYVFVFLNQKKQKLNHVIHTANRNHTVTVPVSSAYVRFGWRVMGSGTTTIQALLWGHRQLAPAQIIAQAEHLLLTNQYPSYDDLYRYGFVHTRVLAYAERGVKVDVFRLRKDETASYHEFQNVDCITGSPKALRRLLDSGRYKSVLVHFLDPAMWEILRDYIDQMKVVIWVHGAEIQPWHRRDYNYETEQERQEARIESDKRMTFWRDLLQSVPKNLKLVFVSHYFAQEVMDDLGFRLPEEAYTIIHNPINTELFSYQPKPLEQRKKILSIRPYASRKYANDLSVMAILELSKRPFFHELEFLMIGDGKLFESVLEPLRKFPNVIIERRFLSHDEIAKLHKKYGVFLNPTRMDAQGVSRDEAMSSGLIPVTNGVTAIPEFVDDSCGILALGEDFIGMAAGIEKLYSMPDSFVTMSAAAALRVRKQSSLEKVVKDEISLLFD